MTRQRDTSQTQMRTYHLSVVFDEESPRRQPVATAVPAGGLRSSCIFVTSESISSARFVSLAAQLSAGRLTVGAALWVAADVSSMSIICLPRAAERDNKLCERCAHAASTFKSPSLQVPPNRVSSSSDVLRHLTCRPAQSPAAPASPRATPVAWQFALLNVIVYATTNQITTYSTLCLYPLRRPSNSLLPHTFLSLLIVLFFLLLTFFFYLLTFYIYLLSSFSTTPPFRICLLYTSPSPRD